MNNDEIIDDQAHRGARLLSLTAARKHVPMRPLGSAILRGCNVHHTATVIRQNVDLGGLAGMHTDEAGPDFASRFLDRFVEMRRLLPDSAMPESFVKRLRSPGGVPFAEVLLEAILCVETAIAFRRHDLDPIGFSAVLPTASPRHIVLVWECRLPRISRKAAELGLAGCIELLPEVLQRRGRERREDFATALARFEGHGGWAEVSTTTAVLALAAKRRGLPCEALSGPYLRLGQGASQRLIYASVTEHTSLAASQLARNKHRTYRRLAEMHIPVARQIRVATQAEALAAASSLGYPVVIKPLNQKQAAGVSVGIMSPNDVSAAFERATQASQRVGQRVVVEAFVPGNAHRLLVVGGRFVAALKITAPTITGDGQRTIADLIQELNSDPLRNGVRLFKVPVDDALASDVALAGYALDDVLAKDKTIPLRAAANVAIGGLHSDVTDSVHEDNQELAIRATAAIGLDVAGVDFITEDISRSYTEVGGAIIEVNARPGLCMHTWPRYGNSRPVAQAVLELLFPPGVSGRIPVAVLAGDRRTRRVAHNLEAILRSSGKSVALALRRRGFVNGEATELNQAQPSKLVPALLRDRRVQTLIGCVSLRRTARKGLGLDSCDVTAIMDRNGHGTAESVARQAVYVLARATRGMLVVSVNNALARQALSEVHASRLVLVASNPRDPAIADHLAAGGAVVTIVRGQQRQDRIVLHRDNELLVSVRTRATRGISARQIVRRNMEAWMFAVALAFGMGVPGPDIEEAMRPGASSRSPMHRGAQNPES